MFQLRELEPGDLARIAELEIELFDLSAWSPAMLAEEVKGFGRWYVVAVPADADEFPVCENAYGGPNLDTRGARTEDSPMPTAPGMMAAGNVAGTEQVLGYAGLWFDGDVTQVMTLGVDPAHHRQGIGQALLQALIDHSIKLGAEEMFLEVAVDNEPALALYRSFGFLPLSIRKRYYQPGNRDAYTMRLQLT